MQTTYTIRYSENQSTTGNRSCKSCISRETTAWSNVTSLPNYDFTSISSPTKTTVRRRLKVIPSAFISVIIKLRAVINYIIPPVSLVTNSLSIAVFFRMRHRIQSDLVLVFIAVSLVDTFALAVMFRKMVHRISRAADLTRYNIGCQVIHWLTGSCQVCSSCLVLLYTFERFVAVRYPLKRAVICSGRRVRMAVLWIFVFAFSSQIYNLILLEVKITACIVPRRNQKMIFGYLTVYLQYVIGIILPYCCIAFLNAMIVYHMIKYRRKRSSLQASNMSSEEKTQRSMTVMLFTASTYSLVMMTPLMAARAMDMTLSGASRNVTIFRLIAEDMISPWNYCGNFFFYVIGGRQFRHELFNMLRFRQTSKCKAADIMQHTIIVVGLCMLVYKD